MLAADKLIQSPRLYATFLLWLLSELFEELPEVGDLDKPKLVFDWDVLQPNADRPEEAEIAVSPTSRAGAVYILDTGRRHPGTHERARKRLRG